MDPKDIFRRMLQNRVTRRNQANPELAAARRGASAAKAVRRRSILAKFDKPMSPHPVVRPRAARRRSNAGFVPSVRLDASAVTDRRGEHRVRGRTRMSQPSIAHKRGKPRISLRQKPR